MYFDFGRIVTVVHPFLFIYFARFAGENKNLTAKMYETYNDIMAANTQMNCNMRSALDIFRCAVMECC